MELVHPSDVQMQPLLCSRWFGKEMDYDKRVKATEGIFLSREALLLARSSEIVTEIMP